MTPTIRRILTLLLALALMLSVCACGKDEVKENTAPNAYTGEPALHVNAYGYDSWSIHYEADENGQVAFSYMDKDGQLQTMPQETVTALLNTTVATCGEEVLSNRDLNLYYQQTMYDFYQQYGSYLAYMMDTTLGMDEQLGMSGESTWQADLLNAAFLNFFQVASLYQEAKAVGFELTEASRTFLDELQTGLDEAAVSYGYTDATAYLADTFGPGITFDDYHHFSKRNALAMDYYSYLLDQVEVTDEQIEAYYTENQETLESQGIVKDDRNAVNVRHILVAVEDSTDEAAWSTAEQEAQALLQQWQDGDATEETFAALATEKTADPGSQSTGGLYENVYPGQMVEPFENWCFEEGRQTGDTGIVKTDYGYHIMYFVGQTDYIHWKAVVTNYCRSNAAETIRTEISAKYETSSDATYAILLDYTAPTVPAATEGESAEDDAAGEASDDIFSQGLETTPVEVE